MKNVGGLNVLVSAHCLMCFIFILKFIKISQRVSELLSGYEIMTNIYKGPKFHKKCRWSYSTHLCSSCDDALYIYIQSFVKISQRVSELLSGQEIMTDRQTDRRKR